MFKTLVDPFKWENEFALEFDLDNYNNDNK